MNTYQPYLIQRVQVRDSKAEGRKGIDASFSFDYMGSAEFEFGALPASLKELRANKAQLSIVRISQGNHIAFFLGLINQVEEAWQLFQRELVPIAKRPADHRWLKEASGIYEAYVSKPKDRIYKADCWWCVDREHAWLLFKEQKHADLWMSLL
jgi:hypothetical protein